MTEVELTDAKQRVLDTAETLFMRKGYNAITLRDIADELGIKQASLYYHFPEGKEQLYMAVVERAFQRHRRGMEQAVAETEIDLASQLRSIAGWFATQPEINFSAMMHADMPALSQQSARSLSATAYQCLFEPLRKVFMDSCERNETRFVNPDVLAGSFLAILDGMAVSVRGSRTPRRETMVNDVISILLDGLRKPAAEIG